MSKEGSLALCILICVQLNQKGVLLSHCIVNSPATAWITKFWLCHRRKVSGTVHLVSYKCSPMYRHAML